jgi:hypothetical protein
VGIFSDKVTVAAGAFKDDMRDSPEGTEAADGNHPAFIGNMSGLHLKIGSANITGSQYAPSLSGITNRLDIV